ncbi:MAG: bifunctional demethylmenaquinone methyltransferase/2-methoxy-6-polyprenyl-1,4-benzoquinol methylase UbiE [Bacteroidales bacterium]|nr:bifunctional demethylmenaquinone methyltransferase/2-methoxy-6-polyprenyl-1,4-benzoquinol methylase UbiE [Bacteroidales bacterium]
MKQRPGNTAGSPEKVKPYDASRPKTEQVEEMFDSIAPAYDFMNRAMTMGIDKIWRAKAVAMVRGGAPRRILDVATGTGDLAIKLARAVPEASVTGIDLSEGMLEIGRQKVASAGLADRIALTKADCLDLPFADGSFDAVTVAYGVRNFENLAAGYREMARVLSPGGMLCVVELSVPQGRIVNPLYRLYSGKIIPAVGRPISRDSAAYSYLPASIAAMPQGERMLDIMRGAGLSDAALRALTFGVCTIYTAFKRD